MRIEWVRCEHIRPVHDRRMTRLHILIPVPMHGELQTLSKRAGLSSSDLIRAAIAEFLTKAAQNGTVVVPLRSDAELAHPS